MKQLFIVGVGRSGTSLLQSMFAAHPRVAMLPETGFFRRYCLPDGGVPFDRLEELRNEDERLQRIPGTCWSRVADDLAPRRDGRYSPWDLYRHLLSWRFSACVAGKDEEDILVSGDKDPRLIEFLPILVHIFPESHFIHIVRDPRDVLASKMAADWSSRRHWRANLAAGVFQLHLADRYAARLPSSRFHVVHYEDLLAHAEPVLQGLCAEIGLDYDPLMLSFSDAAKRLSGGAVEPWKKETLGPLLAGNSGKWKDRLTPVQVRAVEGANRRWMDRYGYTRAGTWSADHTLNRAAGAVGAAFYSRYRQRVVHRVLSRAAKSRPRGTPLSDTIRYATDHPRSTELGTERAGRSRSVQSVLHTFLGRLGFPGMILYWLYLLRGLTPRYEVSGSVLIADHASGVVKRSVQRVTGSPPGGTGNRTVSRSAIVTEIAHSIGAFLNGYRAVRPARTGQWAATANLLFFYAAGRAAVDAIAPSALLISLTSDRKRIGLALAAAERVLPVGIYILDRYGTGRHLTIRPDVLFCFTARQERRYRRYAERVVIMPSPMRDIGTVPAHPRIGVLLNARCDVAAVATFVSKVSGEHPHAAIRVRPHPGFDMRRLGEIEGAEITDWRIPLDSFFQEIDVAFAPNSNVVIDALLHGVPVVYVDDLDYLPRDEHGFVADGIVMAWEDVNRFPEDVNDFYGSDAFRIAWGTIGYRNDPAAEQRAVRELVGPKG